MKKFLCLQIKNFSLKVTSILVKFNLLKLFHISTFLILTETLDKTPRFFLQKFI